MGFTYKKELPTPKELLAELPLSNDLKEAKVKRDEEIKSVFTNNSDKFLMIIGPCSAHNEDAVCEYVEKLAKVQEKVSDKIIIIPRIYTNKPRTTGAGYKGMMHQPNPAEEPNIAEGISKIRNMHLKILNSTHLFAADEMLYPDNYPYLEDLLSYVAIGARSTENQYHRLTVSGMDIPAGMKNPTSGDLEVMMNSIQAGQMEHLFIYNGWEVETPGNPLVHAILRGAVNDHGRCIPNYHHEDLLRTADIYNERKLINPSIIVDTNHANSNKNYKDQPRIAREVLNSRNENSDLNSMIKGLMVESYLLEGAQNSQGKEYGKSITDACLGWEESEKLIYDVAEKL